MLKFFYFLGLYLIHATGFSLEQNASDRHSLTRKAGPQITSNRVESSRTTAVVVSKNTPDWDYYSANKGPAQWHLLKNSGSCLYGKEQSPVNIVTTKVLVKSDLPAIAVNYTESNLNYEKKDFTLVTYFTAENYLYMGNSLYELKEVRVHVPSEHLIDGKKFAAEFQLVHRNIDGKIIIISVLAEKGKKNILLESYFQYMENLFETDTNKTDLKESFDPSGFLSNTSHYFYYKGSLTYPPCTENIDWIILNQPLEISYDQIKALLPFVNTNNRVIQKINKRDIESKK